MPIGVLMVFLMILPIMLWFVFSARCDLLIGLCYRYWWAYLSCCGVFACQAWPADWSIDAVLGDPTHHAVICFWPADQSGDTFFILFLAKLTCWIVCSCRSCLSHCDVFVSQAWPADWSVGAVPGDCTHQAVIFPQLGMTCWMICLLLLLLILPVLTWQVFSSFSARHNLLNGLLVLFLEILPIPLSA